MYVQFLLWAGLFFAFSVGYANAAPKAKDAAKKTGHSIHQIFKHHKHEKKAPKK